MIGSNVRDRIENNFDIPALIEGKEGNDTLLGGESVDVIFTGPGASRTPAGTPFFFNYQFPANGAMLTGDEALGRNDNDFLFADMDLVRTGDVLSAVITPDVTVGGVTEADLIDGAGGTQLPTAQRNHGAQVGVNDVIRNMTGMLIDGGGVKDVFTWLGAQSIMRLNLSADGTTSPTVNMLVDAAFRANDPANGKEGLLSPRVNAILDDFDIESSSGATSVAAATAPSDDLSASDLDAVFADWGSDSSSRRPGTRREFDSTLG